MKTEFTQANKDFSDLTHIAARKIIYPKIFNTSNLTFETTDLKDSERSRIYDGEMGIDRLVFVTVKTLHAPIKFTIQERFRTPDYLHYQDMTVTEWNHSSNLPSELYKINAGLFLYGYFDKTKSIFLDAICVNVTELLLNIVSGKLKYGTRMNPKNQSFFTLKFQDMRNLGIDNWRL